MWDLESCAPHTTIHAHSGGVTALVFTPGRGNMLASIGSDPLHTIRLTLWGSGTTIAQGVGGPQFVTRLAWAPEPDLLAVGGSSLRFHNRIGRDLATHMPLLHSFRHPFKRLAGTT